MKTTVILQCSACTYRSILRNELTTVILQCSTIKKAKGEKRQLQNFISVCRVLQSWGGNKLRAAVCKFREFAVKTEISKSFIFSQRKLFSETFSEITIKVSKEISFERKPAKSEMLPHAI